MPQGKKKQKKKTPYIRKPLDPYVNPDPVHTRPPRQPSTSRPRWQGSKKSPSWRIRDTRRSPSWRRGQQNESEVAGSAIIISRRRERKWGRGTGKGLGRFLGQKVVDLQRDKSANSANLTSSMCSLLIAAISSPVGQSPTPPPLLPPLYCHSRLIADYLPSRVASSPPFSWLNSVQIYPSGVFFNVNSNAYRTCIAFCLRCILSTVFVNL